MSQATVISVNPAKSTLGDLNPGATARILRSRVLEQEAEIPSFKKAINGLFALGNVRGASRSVSLMLVRSLVGAILILSGISSSFGGVLPFGSGLETAHFAFSTLGVLQIVAGSVLCLGLFTRIALAVVGVVSGIMFVAGLFSGEFLQPQAMLLAITAVFALVGPGAHSVDSTIRASLYKAYRNRVRRKAERRLSYEAFRYQQF